MADQKITALPALASAANIDVIPIVDIAGNATKKIEVQNLVPTSNTIGLGAMIAAGNYGTGSDIIESTSGQAVVAGECYAYGATWSASNATALGTANTGLLGIATSTSTNTGLLVRGLVFLATDPGGAVGDNVYLSTSNGTLSTTPVASPNNVSRVVGYKYDTNVIFFDPSKDWIEIS